MVVPPRYDRGDWQEGDGVFNAGAIASYTRRPADRIERHVRAGELPVVLGGDCSIQLGAALALRRIGRYGLVAVDASADFRHPGNSDRVGAAGGEELALATGRGQPDLTDLEGLGPYLRDEDVRVFGIRDAFEDDRTEPAALQIPVVTVGELRTQGLLRKWRVPCDARHALSPNRPNWTASGSTWTTTSSTRPSCRPSTAPTPTGSSPTN